MAYARYATSDTIYALNDDTWQVEILQENAQSQNHKFEVGPAGVQLIYESPEDDILVPGIVHSRCEVETIWPPDVADELEDMIALMIDSEDGVWFMQIYKNSTRFWFGPILIDEVQLQETSAARSCRIVASDGISLLKTVDYNDNGSTYLTDQKIFDDVLTNLQQKWVSYDYANSFFSGAERRLAVCDDVYSQDIYSITTTPPNTNSSLTRRMQLTPHMFSYTNDDNEVEYINCYELLDSICKTLLLRLYYYKEGWYLMPCYNSDEIRGYFLNWSGAYGSGTTFVDGFNYQVDTLNNEKQKGNEWTHTFTPAINEVTITRDTNNGYVVIGENDVGGGSTVDESGITFTTSDSGYLLYGSVTIDRSGLDPTVGILNTNRIGRYVLQFTIRFGTTAGSYVFYNNTFNVQPQGLFSFNANYTIDGNSLVFTPLSLGPGSYESSGGSFYFHNPDGQVYIFDANDDSVVNIPFSIGIPAVEADITGITIIPQLIAVNRDGVSTSALTNSINSSNFTLYFVYNQSSEVQTVPNFDVQATSDFGRGSIDLGKTYIGQLHENLGGIMVETSPGVFETSADWSTVRYDYDDECNRVGVREVLAAHYKPRVVERGNIVMRGNGVAPPPFYLFIDDDTTDVYQCINYRLASTPAEVEVTLHKVGTDGQAQTTGTSKDFGTSPLPNPLPGVGVGATFGVNFTSGFDFNGDAADAFGQDYSSVFTGETIEGYVTNVGPSKGNYFDFQSDTAPSGQDIFRKIYTSRPGLANNTSTWAEIDTAYRPTKNETLKQAITKINEYTAAETSPHRSFIITYKTQSQVVNLLLDDYANAQAAYSVRKLRNAYTGSAMQVRNDSGTLLDIGFDSNGDLDTAAILTHIGSGDGRVATWYDQSGNGRDASQTTLGLMPKIAAAGVVHTVNGKPAIDWNTDNLDTASFAPNPNGAYNFAMVSQYDFITSTQCSASGWASSTGNQNYLQQMQSNGKLRWAVRYSGNALPRPDASLAGAANVQYIQTATFATGTCEAFYNGTQELDKFNQLLTGNPNNHSVVHRIGALNTTGTQQVRGYIQEFVIWSNSTPHDAELISDDLNDYYEAF